MKSLLEGKMLKYTIVINEGALSKKITKIFTLSDGGFAVAVPYHKAEQGHLLKFKFDYTTKMQTASVLESENYIASDRVKLSMHMDGFVQFSGENSGKIISGRDESGKPKGLGYLTSPLTNPIRTGPTTSVAFWGIDDFVDFKAIKPKEIKVLFEQADIFYRDSPNECNGYSIEIFVFPSEYFSVVYKESDGRFFISKGSGNPDNSNNIFKFRVLPSESQAYFFGLLVCKSKTAFSQPSGFTLNAPSELKKPNDTIGTLMAACYPNPLKNKDEGTSLDYLK